jgi:hypothetical protein
MAWLNTPKFIDDGYRLYTEFQSYTLRIPTGFYMFFYRTRVVRSYNELYVGGTKTAADAKATELLADTSYTDVSVTRQDGGQYHVSATRKVFGAWTGWIPGWPPEL